MLKPSDIDRLEQENQSPSVVPLHPTATPPGVRRLSLSDLKKQTVNHKTKHPAPQPVIQISGANFANKGMISALTGPPKSGKTTVIGFIMATCFAQFGDRSKSLDIQSALAEKRDVVYLDFEQHISSTQDLHDKVMLYSGLNETPDNLHILSLLEYTMEERRGAIDTLFEELNMHLLIIDGLADLLGSVNDEESSNAIIEYLALLASKHDTAILTVIHENIGNGLARGHLGGQMMRKCAGLVSIKKDREKQVHSIECKMIRIGKDFETVYFHWCDEEKKMVLCDAITSAELTEEAKRSKEEKENESLIGLMHLCFANMKQLAKADLLALIQKHDAKAGSSRTAERRVEIAMKKDIILFDLITKLYSLNSEEAPF